MLQKQIIYEPRKIRYRGKYVTDELKIKFMKRYLVKYNNISYVLNLLGRNICVKIKWKNCGAAEFLHVFFVYNWVFEFIKMLSRFWYL